MVKMRTEELMVDIEELKKFKRENARERRWFLDFYADYLRKKEAAVKAIENKSG